VDEARYALTLVRGARLDAGPEGLDGASKVAADENARSGDVEGRVYRRERSRATHVGNPVCGQHEWECWIQAESDLGAKIWGGDDARSAQ
jgi:hypothetical protein